MKTWEPKWNIQGQLSQIPSNSYLYCLNKSFCNRAGQTSNVLSTILTLRAFFFFSFSFQEVSSPSSYSPFFVVSTLWVTYSCSFNVFTCSSTLSRKYWGQPEAAMLVLVQKWKNTNKTDLFSTYFYFFKSYEKGALKTKMILPCLIIILFICSLWTKQMFHWLQLKNP